MEAAIHLHNSYSFEQRERERERDAKLTDRKVSKEEKRNPEEICRIFESDPGGRLQQLEEK